MLMLNVYTFKLNELQKNKQEEIHIWMHDNQTVKKNQQESGREQVTYAQDSSPKLTILQQKSWRPEGSGKIYS